MWYDNESFNVSKKGFTISKSYTCTCKWPNESMVLYELRVSLHWIQTFDSKLNAYSLSFLKLLPMISSKIKWISNYDYDYIFKYKWLLFLRGTIFSFTIYNTICAPLCFGLSFMKQQYSVNFRKRHVSWQLKND